MIQFVQRPQKAKYITVYTGKIASPVVGAMMTLRTPHVIALYVKQFKE